jgi:hypothetical protein
VFCAEAGSVTIASAVAPVSNLNMANSLLYDMKAEAYTASYCSLETVSWITSFLDGGQPVSRRNLCPAAIRLASRFCRTRGELPVPSARRFTQQRRTLPRQMRCPGRPQHNTPTE